MKIMVGTDFSPTAQDAVRTAAQLARRLGDSLVLVRAVEGPLETAPELRVPDFGLVEALLRAGHQSTINAAVDELRADGLNADARVRVGVPHQVLCQQAAEEGPRFLVVGRTGSGRAQRLLAGSVAERTVLNARCPVLVVPDGQEALRDRAAGTRPLRVVVGVDTGPRQQPLLSFIAQLRSATACDVTFVHEYCPPVERSRVGLDGQREPGSDDPEVVAVIERELRAELARADGPGSMTLRVHGSWGRIGDALAAYADDTKADLIIVGTRQPHGWERIKTGSTAVGALRAAHTPVLCVPTRGAEEQIAATVPSFKTVLVPTDLSELGNAAVPFAYGLVRGGGTVELCHVHERYVPAPLHAYADRTLLTPEERRGLQARLRALVPADAERLGINTRISIFDGGSAAETVVQAARRLGADAIALASHGRSGLSGALVASVAERVMRGADRPVLVVRGH